MIAITTLLLKILLLLVTILGLSRGLMQIRRFKWTKFVQLTFFVSLVVYSFGQFVDNSPISKIALGTSQGAFIGLFILIFIKTIDRKKNKVMWRLPLITGLVAMFYDQMQVELGYCLIESILLVVAYRFRESFNYVYRQQFKATVMTIPMILSFIYDDSLFYVGLIFVVYYKFQIINALKLKLKMSELNE